MISNSDQAFELINSPLYISSLHLFSLPQIALLLRFTLSPTPFSNPISLICNRLSYLLFNRKYKSFLKPCFPMEIHLHTYTPAITENEMSVFLPKASSATHIFHLLGSLLCQSALLFAVLQPLPLFWILPTADDILKPLHMRN